VKGLVEQPLHLSLADLHQLPKREQITKHNCIQGWTGVAEWGGVSMRDLIERCHPLPTARYVIFSSYGEDNASRAYYEVITLEHAKHPQTILAYEMNHHPLPVPHGAPLRLRCEMLLGYKMVKWLRAIEFVERYSDVRDGQGGSREDNRYYEQPAAI
ncbi:MAG: molybdopterin-dependent oxidoreductase, partial [Ktedonobacterales bacterium]|nr:molybdopterin-dependent oxidoreductase [Ktedonobacterales bacterium]